MFPAPLLADGFVHQLDRVMARPFGLTIYWYGFAYTLAFATLAAWLIRQRRSFGWSLRDVVDAAIIFSASILVCGRIFDIAVYEWDYYRFHPWQMLNWWHGGMASHGLLIGAALAAVLISRSKKIPFLQIADQLVVPGALVLGLGRIGNFIEGGVIGTITSVPWGVKFPDVDGFRHPVALYEGAKNLLLIPLLLAILRRHPSGSGRALAHFIFWYAALRFIIDLFRDYESYVFNLGTGQYVNIATALLGLVLLIYVHGDVRLPAAEASLNNKAPPNVGIWRPVVLTLLILYPLGIPTSWTTANIAEKRAASHSD